MKRGSTAWKIWRMQQKSISPSWTFLFFFVIKRIHSDSLSILPSQNPREVPLDQIEDLPLDPDVNHIHNHIHHRGHYHPNLTRVALGLSRLSARSRISTRSRPAARCPCSMALMYHLAASFSLTDVPRPSPYMHPKRYSWKPLLQLELVGKLKCERKWKWEWGREQELKIKLAT